MLSGPTFKLVKIFYNSTKSNLKRRLWLRVDALRYDERVEPIIVYIFYVNDFHVSRVGYVVNPPRTQVAELRESLYYAKAEFLFMRVGHSYATIWGCRHFGD